MTPAPASAPRIIPARAGFTTRTAAAWRASTDHPRSRGVYSPRRRPWSSAWGSSPLARGLPCPRAPGRRSRSDHPRSRGVYALRSRPASGWAGSSPLARGLRAAPWPPWPGRWDHPRSRGVYVIGIFIGAVIVGSSPLARGLPVGGGGVHGSSVGSSPLARGLRALPRLLREPGRIIPARAGFTSPYATSPGWHWDHPRSRGVYVDPYDASIAHTGSSPLARGLPIGGDVRVRLEGIIPARAGFTRAGRGPWCA